MIPIETLVPKTAEIVLLVLAVAIALTFFRLLRGPTLADRVVALELLTAIAVAIIAVYSMEYRQPLLLDVAIVLALISFLGTVGFSHYLVRVQRR
ncbi:MAG: monovalent cation/H+ antiporter complex subunit F [Armatimonadota bacterium]